MRYLCALVGSCLVIVLGAEPSRASPGIVPPWNAGDAELSLRVGYRERADLGRELLGFITLSLPLEALAMPATPGRPGSPAMLAEGAQPAPVPPAATPPPAPPAPPPPPPPDQRLELTPRLARDLVRVALEVAGLTKTRRRIQAMRSRSHTAAFLPDLKLRGGRTTDESVRWTPTDADPYRFSQAGGTRLFLETELAWRLGHLIYSDAELRIEALLRQRGQIEREFTRRLLATLLDWQRARLRSNNPALLPEERAEALLVMVRAAAELDVLTDGWFLRRVRGAAHPPR